MNTNYIEFPKEEYNNYLERIENKKTIYTTRVSNEVNKYKVNEIYNSVFGLLQVKSIKHFKEIEEHPFKEELTLKQFKEINEYINENGYDLIELKKV